MGRRRVTYYINDKAYMEKLYAGTENLNAILEGINPFACIYVLEGQEDSMFPDHYNLTDVFGRPIRMDSLNGYQRGVVLCAADAHYAGRETDMFGIMEFKEEFIDG